jgi:hypothetical protein
VERKMGERKMQTAEKLPQCERALNQCYVSQGETTRDGRDKEGEEMTELTYEREGGGGRERTLIDNQEVTEGR